MCYIIIYTQSVMIVVFSYKIIITPYNIVSLKMSIRTKNALLIGLELAIYYWLEFSRFVTFIRTFSRQIRMFNPPQRDRNVNNVNSRCHNTQLRSRRSFDRQWRIVELGNSRRPCGAEASCHLASQSIIKQALCKKSFTISNKLNNYLGKMLDFLMC